MPRRSPKAKPSTFLKKCSIAVVGNLGKDVKTSDVEKWTVNNGGTFKSKVDEKTTHAICTLVTFKKDDYALSKKFSDFKKLQFVDWAWLDDTLKAKRVKPVKAYLHAGKGGKKTKKSTVAKKKAIRRQAFLSGKTEDEVEEAEKEEESSSNEASDYEEETKHDHDSSSSNMDHDSASSMSFLEPDTPDTVKEYDLYKNNAGIVYLVHLQGSELLDPEEGDYILSVEVSTDAKLYKASWKYCEGEDEPIQGDIVISENIDMALDGFSAYFENKTGKKWSESHMKSQEHMVKPETNDNKINQENLQGGVNELTSEQKMWLFYKGKTAGTGLSATPAPPNIESQQNADMSGEVEQFDTESEPVIASQESDQGSEYQDESDYDTADEGDSR